MLIDQIEGKIDLSIMELHYKQKQWGMFSLIYSYVSPIFEDGTYIKGYVRVPR